MPEFRIINSDCIVAMREMADNSVDAIVTDPPAGISFMGKNWDHDKGGRDSWIAWMSEVAKECLRVIRPGGHALVWAIPRTSHWTAMGWENAGWEVRDRIAHHFGQGFPKSMNVSIALDKSAGAERTVVGKKDVGPDMRGGNFENAEGRMMANITEPTTEAAKQWSGWGTALKPATEDWWLFRKPVEGTVAANILKHGTGGLNIDGCRVETDDLKGKVYNNNNTGWKCTSAPSTIHGNEQGRWPANLVLSHSEGCRCAGTKKVKGVAGGTAPVGGNYKLAENRTQQPYFNYADPDGTETVEAWECVEGCPIRLMDEQSGISSTKRTENPSNCSGNTWGGTIQTNRSARGHTDSGGASRFFYCAKASKSDRDEGCEGMDEMDKRTMNDFGDQSQHRCSDGANRTQGTGVSKARNHHPTVKPTALMRYLCRLVTPKGGVILDPFMGSGSTGKAANIEGFRFIGIEQDAEYCKIAEARIQYARNNAGKEPEKKNPAPRKPTTSQAAEQPTPEKPATVSAQVSIFEIDNS